MIRRFHVYDKNTGLFAGRHVCIDEHPRNLNSFLALNTPAGAGLFEAASVDHLSQRIDVATGKLVDYVPPAPSADHVWNGSTRRWQFNQEAQERSNRRKAALEEIGRLEASQGRALREAAIGLPGAVERLKQLDSDIAKLRTQLT